MQANLATELLFEMSESGRRTHRLPKSDVPETAIMSLLPASALRGGHPGLLAVPVGDPRLAWHLSAAISASRQPTAATSALLSALTEAAAALPA